VVSNFEIGKNEMKLLVEYESVASVDELKLRIVAAIEIDTPQLLENIWRKTEDPHEHVTSEERRTC
jgi:hypothetical protein